MKHINYLFLALIAVFCATASADAQEMVDENLSHLGSFERIKATLGWDVTFTQSNTSSIQVSYSQEAAEYVQIEVKNGCLTLGLKKSNDGDSDRRKKMKLRATISAPSLRAVKVTTGAEITFATPLNVQGNFSIDATTGADVEGLSLTAKGFYCESTTGASVEAKLNVTNAAIDCTTGADVELSGKADSANLDCTTGGDISAKALVVKKGTCDATTSGDISITINERAKVHTSTGGDITIYGRPKEVVGKTRGVTIR